MDTPQKIGRYEILEELGHGAMGTVYKAKDPAMDRVVALKTIIAVALAGEQGNEFRERFYREARAAGALAHPGIVPVFDVGEHEGMPFLVMEFVPGRTLDDVAKKGERLSLDRVCEIGQKIAEALGYAHKHGVVHRDIKPANILLTSRETHGIERPKITDFGVAKLAEGQTTMTGQMLGTPAFMPPEQFTGSPIDGRADIFSLGVMLYIMATGEQPFPGESITAVSYKVVHTDPVPPGKLNPALPMKLGAIILKCLAKSPADRYQTGEDLARDLGEFRSGSAAATLQSAAPQTTGHDTDDTVYDSVPKAAARAVAATRAPAPATATAGKPTDNRLVLVAVILVALVAGGWFAFRSRQKAAMQTVVPPAPAVAVAPEPPTPAPAPAATAAPSDVPAVAAAEPAPEAPKPATPAKPTAAKAAPAKPAVAKSAAPAAVDAAKNPVATASGAKVDAAPPAVVAKATPEPAGVDFDPKALDPKVNARLRIDATHLPAGLDLTVEMNGKVYWRKSGAAGYGQEEAYFVPPGVQEFRVTARSGALEKASNTVSIDFKAKKKNTLKIELRSQGLSPDKGVPLGLYPDTQVIVTLKQDFAL